MDNHTRVITALHHKQPDKVPYHIWMNKSMKQKMVQYSDLYTISSRPI